MTDYNNIDLNSHEIDCAILDEYSFDTLLLEINCNLPDINKDTVKKMFYEHLNNRVEEAKEIFGANLSNIVKHAQKERNKK